MIHLENQILIKEKYTKILSEVSRIDEKVLSKTEHGDTSLKQSYDPSNQNRNLSNISLQEVEGMESYILPEGPKIPLRKLLNTEYYNLCYQPNIKIKIGLILGL